MNFPFIKLSPEVKIRFLSEFFLKFGNFLFIPLITFTIGINKYSEYIIISSIINGLIPILILGFNFSIIKKLSTTSDLKIQSLRVFNAFILITIFSLFLFLLLLLYLNLFFKNLIILNSFIFAIAYLSAIQMIFFEFLRCNGKSNIYSFFQIFDIFFLIFLVFFIQFFFQLSLDTILFNIIFVKFFSILLIFLFLLKKKIISMKYFFFDQDLLKIYIIPGIIYIFLGLSEWLINYGDKLILSKYLSAVYLSVYFTASMFSSVINSLGSVFWWDLFPKLSKLNYQNKEKEMFTLIKSKNNKFIEYSIYISFLVILVSPIIQKIILNSDFIISHHIYVVFFISFFSHQISTGWEFFCYIKEKGKFILINSITWGIISFMLYYLLIPIYGINGALFSLLFVKVGYSISLKIYSEKIGFTDNLLFKNDIKFIFLYVVIIFLFLIIDNARILNLGDILNNLVYLSVLIFFFILSSKLIKRFS